MWCLLRSRVSHLKYCASFSSSVNRITIGLLQETYNKWERRAPLCPIHIEKLLKDHHNLRFIVQPSAQRIFTNEEYAKAGALLSKNLQDADIILGVKRPREDDLIPNKVYAFFAHVLKNQPENMNLLHKIISNKITLIDYECMVDETPSGKDRRVVSFGRYAGIAGMIDILQGLGQRLLMNGYNTPFIYSPMSYMHKDLNDARDHLFSLGDMIRNEGLPKELEPLVFAFSGRGNVTRGALEIFHILPHEMLTYNQLKELRQTSQVESQKKIYGFLIDDEHLVKRKSPYREELGNSPIDVSHYRSQPCEYYPVFHKSVAPYINVLVNGVYWDGRFPRILTASQARQLYLSGNVRFMAIADISCDVNGSIEFLEHTTNISNPFFTFDPINNIIKNGVTSDGITVMGIDTLPTELPRESSLHFGDGLIPVITELATSADTFNFPIIDESKLPKKMARSCITNATGSLTRRFQYIDILKKRLFTEQLDRNAPTIYISMEGHLFDSGLINTVLNILEDHECNYSLQECNVGSRINGSQSKSNILLKVSEKDQSSLDEVSKAIISLTNLMKPADSTVKVHTTHHALTSKENLFAQFETSKVKDEETIVVFGAGRVCGSLVQYLGRGHHRKIIVVSKVPEEASVIAKKARRGYPVAMDVTYDKKRLVDLIKKANVVISLLPADMHFNIAEICMEQSKHMITSSYRTDQLKSLDKGFREAGITLLTECGLDPGLDHMTASHLIDGIHESGGEVISFVSVCGDLPAPEHADNPLLHKFSWSPRGVINACNNDSTFKKNDIITHVRGEDLLKAAEPFEGAWPMLNLECVPNRNALLYEDMYGISPQTMYRGTLRYKGFSQMMQSFKELGLLTNNVQMKKGDTWSLALRGLLQRQGYHSLHNFITTTYGDDYIIAQRLHALYDLLGLTRHVLLSKPSSITDSFCDLLEDHLSLGKDERDLVLLNHVVHAEYDDGSIEAHSSSLQLYGDSAQSAMSKTVGYTAAVVADLLLKNRINKKGVLLPLSKEIYQPTLTALRNEGIEFVEAKTHTFSRPPNSIISKI